MDIIIASVAQAASALGCTKQTIYQLHNSDPTFPRIFKVGRRRSAILYSELQAWVKTRREHHQISQTRAGSEGG